MTKRIVSIFSLIAVFLTSFSFNFAYCADEWKMIDDTDTRYVRYVDGKGQIHDHGKDTADQAIDALPCGNVQFWSGEHLYNKTAHSVSGTVACELSFTGTGFKYGLQYRGPMGSYGEAVDVFIDGEFYTTVRDINAENDTSRYIALTVTGLSDEAHTVRFISHDGTRVMIDFFYLLLSEGSDAPYIKGDLDGDGSITANDAIYLLYSVFFGKEVYPVHQLSDLNTDGACDANDAIHLLYYVFFGDDYVLTDDLIAVSNKDSLMLIDVTGVPKITSLKVGDTEFIKTPSAFVMPSVASSWTVTGVHDIDGGKSIILSDSQNKFVYNLYIKATAGESGPFEISSLLTNNSLADVRYNAGDIFAFDSELLMGSTAWAFAKESGAAEGINTGSATPKSGTGIYKTLLNSGASFTAWTNVYQTHNRNGFIPMMYFDMGTKGLYTALEWTNGRIEASASDKVSIRVDMDDVHNTSGAFSTLLSAGESFVAPTVYLGVYEGNVDSGSNIFKKWFLKNKAPDNLYENENEPLNQMDMQIGNDVAKYNFQSIKWDYGWWANEASNLSTSWKPLEGSWVVRSSAYLGVLGGRTLAQYGANCKTRGVNFTLYILLHSNVDKDGNPVDTEGEFNSKTHPEWFSQRRIAQGMGNSADLGEIRCVWYLKNTLTAFMKKNRVGTWRSDFEPICYYSDKKNRHDASGTDVQYWATVGFGDLLEHLMENVPDFRYESCSSGGSMKDFFVAKYASNFNLDDSANYLSLRTTFYDSSYCFHPVQLQQPMDLGRFVYGSNYFNPKYDEKYADAVRTMGLRTIMLSAIHTSCWGGPVNGTLPYGILPELTEYLAFFNEEVKPLMREGELYHVLPRPDGTNWDGVMYAKDGEKALVFLFKPSDTVSDTVTVKAQGLDRDASYSVVFTDATELNCTMTGKELMENGVTARVEGVGSEIVKIIKK